MSLSRADMASLIESTLLGPEVAIADVHSLIDEALNLGIGAICVPPNMLNHTKKAQDAGLRVVSVAGFPHGKSTPLIKAAEARLAVQYGATEIDVVLDIAVVKAADENTLLAEIVAIREAVPHPVVLKLIVESAVLSLEAISVVTRAARAAGVDFITTSTGFHPAGGASPSAVKALVAAAQGQIKIKATGEIDNWDTAAALVAAGANRIGSNNPSAVLSGF